MAEVEDPKKERFCWVKAVMQAAPCDAAVTQSAPWTLPCAVAKVGMPPPPSPAKAVDARGLVVLGSGTPPPDQNMIPKIAVGANAQSSQAATDDFWRMASFAPGAELPDGSPVVTLAFMPILGSRADVRAWRLLNPEWFKDAVAVSLLCYEW